MFTPTTSGLVLRLETNDGVTETNGVVTSWQDLSGNGNDLDVVEGDPRLGEVLTPTGLAAVSFDGGSDGSDDSLSRNGGISNLVAGSGDRTMFVVVKYDAVGTYGGFAYGQASLNQTFGLIATPGTGSSLAVQGWGTANDFNSGVSAPGAGWIVHTVVVRDSHIEVYANGVLIDEDSHIYNTVVNNIVLGANIGGSGPIDMNVAAVMVYDHALSASDRQGVEAYLHNTYIDNTSDDAPIANPDSAIAPVNSVVTIDVLANDFDDGNALDASTVSIVSGPSNGQIVGIDTNTGAISYQFTGGAAGDTFTYEVADATGHVSTAATVTVTGSDGFSLDGFVDEGVVTSGLGQPVSLEFLPDNRILLLEKTGTIYIVDPESGEKSLYLEIQNINSGSERGLLDIAIDPDFANNGYIYLFYTPASPAAAQIVRYHHEENSGGLTSTASLSSATVLWQDTDGYISCCHYGGGLDFGPDGKLWLTSSDKFTSSAPGEGSTDTDLAVNLEHTSGKIIRINKDGSIPDGTDGWPPNPYITTATDPDGTIPDSIWAYGFRNPFRASWDLDNGYMYVAEVGGNQAGLSSEDLHLVSLDQGGVFYGSPFYEGVDNVLVNTNDEAVRLTLPMPDSDLGDPANGDYYSAPIFSINRENGASITGGEVYRGTMFPSEWNGVYFYGDYTRDYIRYLTFDASGTHVLGDYAFKPSTDIPGTTPNIVYIGVGNDGALYYINYSTTGGQLRRIVYQSDNHPPVIDSVLGEPTAGGTPLDFTFTAHVTDQDGDSLNYTFVFGDGQQVSGTPDSNGDISVTHSYGIDGHYTVSLHITDGTTTTFSAPVDVTAGDPNDAPTIDAIGADPGFIDAGGTVNFTATVSDLDNDTLTYTWHFGDGTTDTGTAPVNGLLSVSHDYTTDGSYQAYLVVSDTQDETSSTNLAIQVGQPTSVGVTAGLVLELESTIKVGLNGTTVANWLDGSGSGNNLTGTGDPQLVMNATPTGRPAIVFDGVGDSLFRTNGVDSPIDGLSSGSQARTVFFVVKYEDPNGVYAGFAYGNGAPDQAFGLIVNGANDNLTVQGWGSGNDDTSTVNGPNSGWIVQSVVMQDGGAFTHYVDGQVIDTGNNNFNTILNKIVIGEEIKGLGNAPMSVAAVLVYNRALTENERQQVETYLESTYISGTPPVNTDPVAVDDGFTTTEGSLLAVSLLDGLLSNDTDADNQPLEVTSIDGNAVTDGQVIALTHGDLTIHLDGSFTFAADTGFTGDQTFTYDISDGAGGVDTATVTITIDPASSNTPPVANNDAYSGPSGSVVGANAATGLLSNDTDIDGQTLTVLTINNTVITNGQVIALAHGDLTINTDGSFSFAADSGYVGDQTFTYTAGDGAGGTDTATATITLEQSSSSTDVPITDGLVVVLEADSNVALVGGSNTVSGWLDGSGNGNDLTAAGDPQHVQGATPSGLPAIELDGNGDFLARSGATDLSSLPSGSEDRTVFFVVDYIGTTRATGAVFGNGAQNEAFGLVVLNSSNDLAVQGWGNANDFSSGVDAGDNQGNDEWLVQSAVLSGNQLTQFLNGVQIDSDTHVFNTNTGAATSRLVIGQEIAGLGFGVMNVAAVLIYDRALTDAERLQVEDFLQQKYLTVPSGSNNDPVAVDDVYNVLAGNTVTATAALGLLSNDSDIDGQTLAVASIDGNAITDGQVIALAHGDLTIHTDGSFSFLADTGFAGDQTFTYVVADGAGGVDTATVTVSITDPGSPPPPPPPPPYNIINATAAQETLQGTAADDAFTFAVGTSTTASIDVVQNWQPGDVIDLSAWGFSPGDLETRLISGGATLKLIEGFATTDFQLKVNLNGHTVQEVLDSIIYSTPVSPPPPPPPPPSNTPPVAVDDTASTTDQNPVVIDAAGNDTDADNDTLNVSAFNQPANGTVTQLVDGTLQYVADAGFSGDDTFGYTVSDGNGGTDTGTVTVTVELTTSPPPPPPPPPPSYNIINATAAQETLKGTVADDAFTFAVGTSVVGAIDVVQNWQPGDVIDLSAWGFSPGDLETRLISSGSTVKLIEGFNTGDFQLKVNLNGYTVQDVLDSIIYSSAAAQTTTVSKTTIMEVQGVTPDVVQADVAAKTTIMEVQDTSSVDSGLPSYFGLLSGALPHLARGFAGSLSVSDAPFANAGAGTGFGLGILDANNSDSLSSLSVKSPIMEPQAAAPADTADAAVAKAIIMEVQDAQPEAPAADTVKVQVMDVRDSDLVDTFSFDHVDADGAQAAYLPDLRLHQQAFSFDGLAASRADMLDWAAQDLHASDASLAAHALDLQGDKGMLVHDLLVADAHLADIHDDGWFHF